MAAVITARRQKVMTQALLKYSQCIKRSHVFNFKSLSQDVSVINRTQNRWKSDLDIWTQTTDTLLL